MTEYCTCLIVTKELFDGKYIPTEKYFLPDVLIIPFIDGYHKDPTFPHDRYPRSYVQRLERTFAMKNEI
jgi:hypothetical protein